MKMACPTDAAKAQFDQEIQTGGPVFFCFRLLLLGALRFGLGPGSLGFRFGGGRGFRAASPLLRNASAFLPAFFLAGDSRFRLRERMVAHLESMRGRLGAA